MSISRSRKQLSDKAGDLCQRFLVNIGSSTLVLWTGIAVIPKVPDWKRYTRVCCLRMPYATLGLCT